MRLKLFTAFLLAISALALVGYISYEGLNHLMTTLIATSKPDQRVEEFRKLNHLIAEAENSVRIFTITKDRSYLNEFYKTSETIETHLETLNAIAKKDQFLVKEIDSISTLVHNKITLQNQLIHLKRQQKKSDVYQKVVQEIESLESKPPKIDTIEEKVEKKGLLRKIFGGTKEETKLKIDTLEEKKDISKEIASSLSEYEKEEQQLEKYLTNRELILTRRDKAITDKIVAKIDTVEKYFEKVTQNRAEAASETLDETKQLINIIGATSAVLILFLIFIILNDYQVIQQNRKKLELAKQKAEHLAKVKDDFLSNMSHEIRTPLNAVVGFTEQLKFTPAGEDQKKYVRIIYDASQHLLSIINDILDYAKIEAGKISLEKIPVDLNQCIDTVYESLRPKASEKNLTFTYSIDETFKKQGIIGDPVRIKQILFNLINNAIKFTNAGEIRCQLLKEERKYHQNILKIIISDTGIGIASGQKYKIFQKFDQADSSTTRKYGGTGLGLSIVKQLVSLHRGKIEVDSELNIGTTFTITIPIKLAKLPEDANEKIEQIQKQIDLSDKKLLVADDEDYNLMLLENILKKYNTRTNTAHTGYEVIEALKEENYDLLMLDLQMPDLDGISTAKKIRKSGLKIPIIAITAAVTPEKEVQSKNAGIDEIIAKPISEKSLVNVLVKFLSPEKTIPVTTNNDTENKQTVASEKIDFQHLTKLIESDDFINIEMIALYANNLKQMVNTLNESFQSNNYDQIKLSAHKMLPSTRHMGLDKLVNNLQTLETLAQSPVDTKKINEELELFNILAKETLITIENYVEYAGR